MTTYADIVIDPAKSFGGDDTISALELFVLGGTGSYSGGLPTALSVTANIGGKPTALVVVLVPANPLATSGTFTWTTVGLDISGLGLAIGAETVAVTNFGGTSVSSSLVNFDLACFTAGTLILTPTGEVAVETLQPGDLVLTQDGSAQRLIWIASRPASIDDPADRAVRIRADAFGAGRPIRDLVVSPKHGIWLDGVSVPAIALLDGVKVLREPGRAVTYHHIAAAEHLVLLSDGMPTESYCPLGSVPAYADAPTVANPLPRLEQGTELRSLRARHGLMEMAPEPGELRGNVERIVATTEGLLVEGWASQGGSPLELRIVAGNVACEVPANGWRTDLDRVGLPAAAFRAVLPVHGSVKVAVMRATDGARIPSSLH